MSYHTSDPVHATKDLHKAVRTRKGWQAPACLHPAGPRTPPGNCRKQDVQWRPAPWQKSEMAQLCTPQIKDLGTGPRSVWGFVGEKAGRCQALQPWSALVPPREDKQQRPVKHTSALLFCRNWLRTCTPVCKQQQGSCVRGRTYASAGAPNQLQHKPDSRKRLPEAASLAMLCHVD